MTRGPTASARKIATRIDACEIFHKVVAMPGTIPDNGLPLPFFHCRMLTEPRTLRSPLD